MSQTNKDPRLVQSDKEALFTLAAYGLYFLWWYGFAYGLGDADPETYTYVFGLPAWFFYSCVLGYVVLTIALWLMVRFVFRNVPLDDDISEMEQPSKKGKSRHE